MTTTTASTVISTRQARGRGIVDPEQRVGDRDREKTAHRLGQALTQGYLSLGDYEDRITTAFQAETAGALQDLLTDLPIARIVRRDPRRIAARTAAARRALLIHLSAYLTIALLMIGIWLATAAAVDTWYFWPLWPIIGGGIGVVSHGLCVRRRTAIT